jgi:monoterpene epsilon-lactone hydrolase
MLFANYCVQSPGRPALPNDANGSMRLARFLRFPATSGCSRHVRTGFPSNGRWRRAATLSGVVLFFHGGGYCSGSIASHRGMVTEAGRAAGARTLAVGYRLAPEHPFPAAIEDARAAYHFLLDQGIAPSKIAIGGDSAGGGLALALMTTLRDAGQPLPGCAWLVSPWVDLQMTGASLADKANVDPLISKSYLEELASAYLAGRDPADPLVSPRHADLAGLPPLLVQVGSAETLLDDALRIARRAGAADVRIDLEIWPHMIHAWHLWATQLEDGRRAIASAGAFIRAQLQRSSEVPRSS